MDMTTGQEAQSLAKQFKFKHAQDPDQTALLLRRLNLTYFVHV